MKQQIRFEPFLHQWLKILIGFDLNLFQILVKSIHL